MTDVDEYMDIISYYLTAVGKVDCDEANKIAHFIHQECVNTFMRIVEKYPIKNYYTYGEYKSVVLNSPEYEKLKDFLSCFLPYEGNHAYPEAVNLYWAIHYEQLKYAFPGDRI